MTSKNTKGVRRFAWIWLSFIGLSLIIVHPLLRLAAIGAPTNGSLIAAAVGLILVSLGIALWITTHEMRSRWLLLAAAPVVGYLATATFINGLYAQRWLSYVQQTQMMPAQEMLHDDGRLPAREVARLKAIIEGDDYLVSSAISAAHMLRRARVSPEGWRHLLAGRLAQTQGWQRDYFGGFLAWAEGRAEWPTQAPPPPTMTDLVGVNEIWKLGLRSLVLMDLGQETDNSRAGHG